MSLGKKCNKFMWEEKKLQLVRSMAEVQVTSTTHSFKSRSDSLTDGSKLWATLLLSYVSLKDRTREDLS